METLPININHIHKHMFKDSWQYDTSILKLYVVIFKLKYIPRGGIHSKNIYVYEYDQIKACYKAYANFNKRTDDKIISVQAIAINTSNP